MMDLIKGFFVDALTEAGATFNEQLLGTLESMLRIETLPATSGLLTVTVVEKVYQYIYTFAIALVVLKFLFKGFQIYVLWRDGDADSSPQDMLVGAVQATVVIVVFPFLYEIMADITMEFTRGILSLLSVSPDSEIGITMGINLLTLGLAELIIEIIYLILFAVLYVKLIQRGFELLILRLGVPFACLGLIDSDFGIWKSYMQIFYKTLFTSAIQIVLLSLSMPVVELGHPIIGIAIISTAFAAPNILQQFMVPTGRGGGLTNKIYTGTMAVRAIRGLAGR